MTNKIQISHKYPDGTIVVVGGDTPEEFTEFYEKMTPLFAQMEEHYYKNVDESTKTYGDKNETTGTFQVENIKLASGGEHPRWVVQGGNFTKYGITCWPEVLEKAGIVDKLDPMGDNKPQGSWIAHYINKIDGKPDKVTKLERSE